MIRTVINSAYRLPYPFLPLFAAGMGVSLNQMGLAFSIRSVLGVVSPFLATLADTHGRKKGMMLGLVLFGAGCLTSSLMPHFLGFILGSSLVVIANGVFIPSMQSYLSDKIPYEKRGRVLSIAELSWSLGFIIGVPILGYLLKTYHWWSPFIALSFLAVVLIAVLWFFIPEDKALPQEKNALTTNLSKVLRYAPVLAGVLTTFLFTSANEVVNLVFGQWIKDSFGLAFETLAIASIVIGSSEFASEFLSALFLDKMGKTRAIFIALFLNILALFVLPFGAKFFSIALLALSLFSISFEIALIAFMTYMSELMPSARATVMAITIATFSLGRMGGSLIGPSLYRSGFWFNCATAVLLNLASILFFRFFQHKSNQKSV
ncbi:MAG: MFS transporter [Anaerolineaceae bacterium]|nr:MFS transporter [Anaerolineaceae bacterium]